MKTERSNELTVLFWSSFAAFIIHVFDETLMFGGFVAFIQNHFWAEFGIDDFYDANAIWLVAIGASTILYDLFGKKLAFLPMFFLWERVLNGLFHLGLFFIFKKYVPGLASSFLFFVLFYFVCRYGVALKYFNKATFIGSGVVAFIFESLFISSMWWAH